MIHNQTTIEFQTQAQVQDEEDGFQVSSPPLWRNSRSRSGSRNDQHSSPLLPHNHHYSSLSPTSRTRAIAQGRRELMEMVQAMPESCFELSLKDMVEEHSRILQEEPTPAVEEDAASCYLETEAATIKKQNKKKKMRESNKKGGVIQRAKSMDNEAVQIKMIFPSSLGPKRKAKARDSSRVSPRPSFQQSEDDRSKDGWMKRLLDVKKVENNEKGSSIISSRSSSNSSSTSSGSRNDNGSLFPSCWKFFQTTGDKTKRSQGCIF